MKKNNLILTILFIALFLSPFGKAGGGLYAQNIGINSTGSTPNTSAGLDVDFNNKGLLIPRITTAQRNAIASPAHSLLIYNTTTDCFEAWNQTTSTWVSFGCIGCQLPGTFSATTASSIVSTGCDANWTASSGATGYYLDVNTNSSFTGTVILSNQNAGSGTTYSVTGLTCGTTYYYRIRANNACGTSANSNTITLTTSACCASCAPTIPITFNYTGAMQTWIVPVGVTCIKIEAWGASGGRSLQSNLAGALGGYVYGTKIVTPGDVLNIYVGGLGATGGAGGWNGGGNGNNNYAPYYGGGGGGASDVRIGGTLLINRIIIGGGGGGAGDNAFTGNPGGTGGYPNGSDTPCEGGGTQTTGGDFLTGCGAVSGNAGGLGYGGNALGCAGGGGGGYYGGGGGGGCGGYGGGGGSGYIVGMDCTTGNTNGTQSGNGKIVITY